MATKYKATKDAIDAAASHKVEERELQRKASSKEKEHNGSKGKYCDTVKSNPKPEEKQDNEDLPLVQSVSVDWGIEHQDGHQEKKGKMQL